MGQNGDQHVAGSGAAELSVESFRAELDVFSGPLDLLLYLIQRDEIDVLEVSISDITETYLEALRAIQMFDVNVAAEFLVMAATLMDIKSRTLLPQTLVEEEEEGDPRDELVRQLLQYKRFKLASEHLAGMGRLRALRFARVPAELPQEERRPISLEQLLQDVTIWDMVSAYAEVVRQIRATGSRQIIYDEVPLGDYMDEVVAALDQSGGESQFLDFFCEDSSRPRVLGVFLALLELVRRRRVALQQREGEKTQIGITIVQPPADGDREAVETRPPVPPQAPPDPDEAEAS